MSTTAYVERLRQTETYKAGVIEDIVEYALRSRLNGLMKTLPQLPKANDDRHVVVIEVTGDQPSVYTVLTDSHDSINPSMREVDKLVFIFLNVKPQTMRVNSVAGGYILKDGQPIDVNFELLFQISDTRKFWSAARDPIEVIRSEIINQTRKYMLNLNSMNMIGGLLSTEDTLEQRVLAAQTSAVMSNLENEIRRTSIKGVDVIRVHATIALSKQLQDLLQRKRDAILGPGGVIDHQDSKQRTRLERNTVDTVIDQDRTFAPYALRDVIRALDMRLLENFYSMPYGDAMRLVHQSFEDARAAYFSKQQEAELASLEDKLARAKRMALPKMIIDQLEDEIGQRLLRSLEDSPADDEQLRRDFLAKRLGLNPSSRLLSG